MMFIVSCHSLLVCNCHGFRTYAFLGQGFELGSHLELSHHRPLSPPGMCVDLSSDVPYEDEEREKGINARGRAHDL